MGGKGKKKRNSKDSSSSNNGNGEEGEKKKDGKKKSSGSKSLGCDIFNDVAMENAYYVCHNVQVNINIRVRSDKYLAHMATIQTDMSAYFRKMFDSCFWKGNRAMKSKSVWIIYTVNIL